MENEHDVKEGDDVADADREGEGVDHGLVEQEDDQEGQGPEDRSQPNEHAVDDHCGVAGDEDEGVDVRGKALWFWTLLEFQYGQADSSVCYQN